MFPLPVSVELLQDHFFTTRLLRGLAMGRSLLDDAMPMEKRLLAGVIAGAAPKLKAGFGVALALKLNPGMAALLLVAPNLKSPCGALLGWLAVLVEMPLLRPLVAAPNTPWGAFAGDPNWNPLV